MDKIGLYTSLAALERPAAPARASAAAGASGKPDFVTSLGKAIDQVSAAQRKSSALALDFQLEKPGVTLEETMLAMNKASIGFQGLVQVRNRMVAAYQEVMNMQV